MITDNMLSLVVRELPSALPALQVAYLFGSEVAIDAAQRLMRLRALGLPQGARHVFTLLKANNMVSPDLADRLGKVTGFCNIAMHDARCTMQGHWSTDCGRHY